MSADNATYTTFALAPAARMGEARTKGLTRTHREFLDFVVDGRPLLLRLDDLDAVSPLASDVPPAILTHQVRGLLLEEPAPLPGGRFVIYACPECEDLGCGAVTAVIERAGGGGGDRSEGSDGGDRSEGGDGGDYIWRDFAWQTADGGDGGAGGAGGGDAGREPYEGLGPFRFRGAEYRAVLGRLLTGDGALVRRRVLLIGARVSLLARVAAALRTIGIGAEITAAPVDIPADELRTYGAVLFGGAVQESERAAVRAAFTAAGAEVAYVSPLAPLVPLLVAQLEHALDRSPAGHRRLTRLTVSDGAAELETAATCWVSLVAHRAGGLRRVRTTEVFDGRLDAGTHRIALDAKALKGRCYLVARTGGSVLTAPGPHAAPGATATPAPGPAPRPD
ncbi:oxidoreductase [Streptomyces sp. NPDC050504]|uniref:oxidoreductase n=1 Tax=Streptomyces sp. NPDC050504 TaxID=3365618 RepID=UPI00379B76AA